MASKQRDTKKRRRAYPAVKGESRGKAGARRKKPRTITLMASAGDANETVDRILEYYRPLKKPVTLRLDADVLAWFKKGGKRYQTRINLALRKVMERERKTAGV
jgi:uncharacterized protein (DUF4415 family)